MDRPSFNKATNQAEPLGLNHAYRIHLMISFRDGFLP